MIWSLCVHPQQKQKHIVYDINLNEFNDEELYMFFRDKMTM